MARRRYRRLRRFNPRPEFFREMDARFREARRRLEVAGYQHRGWTTLPEGRWPGGWQDCRGGRVVGVNAEGWVCRIDFPLDPRVGR